MAGNLKRKFPDEQESVLLIKALRDSNIPKFLNQDLPLFNALIMDLFPETKYEEQVNKKLLDKAKVYS